MQQLSSQCSMNSKFIQRRVLAILPLDPDNRKFTIQSKWTVQHAWTQTSTKIRLHPVPNIRDVRARIASLIKSEARGSSGCIVAFPP
eukprot:scaffold116212_cov15-Tisochrysis_lutea.AAC.1